MLARLARSPSLGGGVAAMPSGASRHVSSCRLGCRDARAERARDGQPRRLRHQVGTHTAVASILQKCLKICTPIPLSVFVVRCSPWTALMGLAVAPEVCDCCMRSVLGYQFFEHADSIGPFLCAPSHEIVQLAKRDLSGELKLGRNREVGE